MNLNQLYAASKQQAKLLTSEEVAQKLGLKSRHTLEVWRCTKRYPQLVYIKVGRLIRYSEEAVEQFLKARTVGEGLKEGF
jgi:predicted DNA-binding transcriptional regulator AlpA